MVQIGCELVFMFCRFDSGCLYEGGDSGWRENLNFLLSFLKVHDMIVMKLVVKARKSDDGLWLLLIYVGFCNLMVSNLGVSPLEDSFALSIEVE